jgi:HSP20 family protein
MFLTRTNNYYDLVDTIESMFNNSLTNNYRYSNCKVDDDVLSMTFDVPGFSKDELNISAENNTITIDGTVSNRTFNKSFKVGNQWDVSKASASVKNGVLDIKIPKLESKRKKTIEIKVK